VTQKKTILDFLKMKANAEPISFVTAYDYPMATFAERAGLDMILVGDSVGMVVYGYENTLPVTMEQMIYHTEAVRRGAPNTFVVGDMPFASYQSSSEAAVLSAMELVKKTNCDAIKLEGGVRVVERIKAISDAGIPVMGHIGLTPQSSSQLGGFKAQGRTAESALQLLEDALAVEKAGAFALLLEAVPPEVGGLISSRLSIPVLGIGGGDRVDGQLLIVGDMLGLFESFTPKFVKKYTDLASIITAALTHYRDDVKNRRFPEDIHCYKMAKGESERLQAMLGDK
jgi:3-methyl-2-oxobutanoate hydroxymethyltransferase